MRITRIDGIGLPNAEPNTYDWRDHYAHNEDGEKHVLTIEDGVVRLFDRSKTDSQPIIQMYLTGREQATRRVNYPLLINRLNYLLNRDESAGL